MDDKERLEGIKKNAIDYYERITLNQKDFMWLIERAGQSTIATENIIKLGKKIDSLQGENIGLNKRVRDLKEHLNANRKYLYTCNTSNERLEQQNKRYREGLRYLYDRENDFMEPDEDVTEFIEEILAQALEGAE